MLKNKLFAIAAFVLIDAFSVRSLGAMSCQEIFRPSWASLTHTVGEIKEVRARFYSERGDARKSWEEVIFDQRFSETAAWRGMFLTPEGLARILEAGLDPKKSKEHARLYFTKDPAEAFEYATTTWSRSGGGKKLRVIFEVESTGTMVSAAYPYKGSTLGNENHQIAKDLIPLEKIGRIYIFDASMPVDFPFVDILQIP